MKPLPLVLLATLASTAFVHSQDVDQIISQESVLSATARLIGPIPDGTPPSPAPPPPKLVFRPQDVVTSRSVTVGQRQMIFQKVTPIELPPIPEPAPTLEPTDPVIQARLGELQEEYKSAQLVFVGASVFRFKDHPGEFRTFVRFWPGPGSEPIALWSSANWDYLTGFASYEGADGQPYALLMACSSTTLDRLDEINQRAGREEGAPPLPEFRKGSAASFMVVEGAADDDSLGAIRSLHELYDSDLARLKAAWLGRKRAAEERAEFLKANPPEKKNIVLKYWRLDRAGQNGATPKPADIR